MQKNNAQHKATLVTGIFGILFGLLAIAFGIATFIMTDAKTGYYVSTYYKYGSDYYTDSYYAMAMTARYMESLVLIVGFALGCLLLVLGSLILMHHIKKLCCTFKSNTSSSTSQSDEHAKDDNISGLKELFEMKESGIITEEEFNQKKNQFLRKI